MGSAHGTWYAGTTAHEIGHAFGLGTIGAMMRTSCRMVRDRIGYPRARPSFCPCIPTSIPKFQLKKGRRRPSNSFRRAPIRRDQKASPSNSKSQIQQGLHQVILIGGPRDNDATVKACRGLSGERDTVVEFEYDGVIPSAYGSSYSSSLSDLAAHLLSLQVVDLEGNLALTDFSLVEASPYLIATLEGHRNWVSSLSFSPDGTTLASAGSWGTVILWDVATQERIATLQGYAGREVSFSPDGTTLALRVFGHSHTMGCEDPRADYHPRRASLLG